MIKEIVYGGIDTDLSDYGSVDGSLELSHNLLHGDDSLSPIGLPKVLTTLTDGHKALFIHKTSAFTHYIIHNTTDNTLYWIDKDFSTTENPQVMQLNEQTLKGVYAIGNTLLVVAEEGMTYILWDTDKYKELGNHFPEIDLQFALEGTIESEYNVIENLDVRYQGGHIIDDEKHVVSNALAATVNKFIFEHGTEKNKFIFPFFVRYALRLYDNESIVMQSAPIFMPTSTRTSVFCSVSDMTTENRDELTSMSYSVFALVHKLQCALSSDLNVQYLNKWKDIVTGIDIYISKPIYDYDQSSTDTPKILNSETAINEYTHINSCISVCKQTTTRGNTLFNGAYSKKNMLERYEANFNEVPSTMLEVPLRKQEDVLKEIADNSLFYLAKSYKFDELTTDFRTIEFVEGTMKSLVTRQLMTDDYDSHCRLIPSNVYNYNNRINLAGLDKQLYRGYNVLFGFANTNFYNTTIRYYIKIDGTDHIVESSPLMGSSSHLFLYYPDTRAYKAVLKLSPVGGHSSRYYEVSLKPHATLNGAYFFNEWNDILDVATELDDMPSIPEGNTNIVNIKNKIYTSEVNNPFLFPVAGINTVGTGEIYGITSAAKAMSQGQFGQYPLYAFTTEGVWALKVSITGTDVRDLLESGTGTYSSIQPITRDVCINAGSITQLDSTVLFATDRGIMMLSGSNSQCISDNLNTDYQFDPSKLPNLAEVLSAGNIDMGIGINSITYLPFREFIKECGIIYVYTKQIVILYNKNCSYAYVYNLKTKKWGMQESSIDYSVNSYPDALAVEEDGTLITLSETEDNPLQGVKGLLVTRPLKLDLPNDLKTITSIIQRGTFRQGSIKSILYGSRDLFNWFLVSSSRDHTLRGMHGTPYKYFRLALICDMKPDESLYGCTVEYEPRMQNQLR